MENGVSIVDLEFYLYGIARRCKEEQMKVACRSKEAQEILDQYDVPNVNINTTYYATFNKINFQNVPCYHHTFIDNNIRCSLNIVQYMRKYMHSPAVEKLIKELNKTV